MSWKVFGQEAMPDVTELIRTATISEIITRGFRSV